MVVPMLTLIWAWALCQVLLWGGRSQPVAVSMHSGCPLGRLPASLGTSTSFPVFEVEPPARVSSVLPKEAASLTT